MSRILTVLALCLLLSGNAAADNTALWQSLRDGNHFALLRHALAPGTGDPAAFALDDCATQRNITDDGRAQARRIGDRLRKTGITAVKIYTSQWCRCRETAKLLKLGTAPGLPALNSFFEHFDRAEHQTKRLKQWIAKQPLTGPLILVTHQVNISALTNTYASSGEMVIVRRAPDGVLSVVGTIKTP
jgi:phosphohistidine phosphatase SixA